ncbi:MAG: DUF63 family protein, partial [Candidatus Aenigmatarchaeota archaeon]
IVAALGAYKLLQKLNVKIDKRFFLALLPFIVYGGWTRALHDHALGIYESGWWWCSPPIYFVIFVITLGSLLAGLRLEQRKIVAYEKFMWLIGGLLLLYDLSITKITNLEGFFTVLWLAFAWAALLYGFSVLKSKWLSGTNAAILWSHLLDASSTFTAVTFYGFYEQHVLPGFMIDMAGPWIMFPLKLAVVWAVLYYIDREKGDQRFKDFLKMVILILGLALGVRDWLTLSMI